MYKKNLGIVALGVIILVTVFTPTVMAEPAYVPTENEIKALTYDGIIPANPKFKNVNLVLPGETVRVPVEGGGYAIYAVKHKEKDGLDKYDCLWRVAERHLTDYGPPLTITPVSTVTPANTPPGETTGTEPAVIQAGIAWTWWYLLVLVPFAVWLIYDHLTRRRNPAHHPPVMVNGLARNDQALTTQLQVAYPQHFESDTQIERIEHGYLRRRNTWRWEKNWPFHIQFNIRPPLHVTMLHGDGKERIKYLHENDPVVRVTYTGGVVRYFRSACGNLSTLRTPNEVNVDDYVEFVPQEQTLAA